MNAQRFMREQSSIIDVVLLLCEGIGSNFLPLHKSAGVIGVSSFESPEIVPIGLELSTISNWQNSVEKSSKLSTLLPIVRRRCFFALFTAASQSPPECSRGNERPL